MPLAPADTRPMTRRESEARRFARARYGLRGTLALHRHALGLDLLRAPLNVMLSPLFLLTRLLAPLLRWIGLPRAAAWLAGRRIFLKSDMARVIEADLTAFVADLTEKGLIPHAPPEIAARGIEDYAETRNAVSEITTSALVLASGLLLFHRATPGVISLAGPIANLRAQTRAIEDFALGADRDRAGHPGRGADDIRRADRRSGPALDRRASPAADASAGAAGPRPGRAGAGTRASAGPSGRSVGRCAQHLAQLQGVMRKAVAPAPPPG